MKVLVATRETQGKRKNDFNHADSDELVRFVFECDGESVDGGCGCRRSMSGVNSLKATTTLQVKNKELNPEEYKTKIRESLQKGGWNPTEKMVADEAKELLRIANYFPDGTVLEKRGDTFAARNPKAMIKAEQDICSICGQDVEKTLDGDRFCNKCGWIEEFEKNKQ